MRQDLHCIAFDCSHIQHQKDRHQHERLSVFFVDDQEDEIDIDGSPVDDAYGSELKIQAGSEKVVAFARKEDEIVRQQYGQVLEKHMRHHHWQCQ